MNRCSVMQRKWEGGKKGRKGERKAGRKKGRKIGRREGRKEKRKEEKKEGVERNCLVPNVGAQSVRIIFVNNQLDAQFFFLYLFIPILYMFRATKCSSSGESIVSIRHLVYVTVCR